MVNTLYKKEIGEEMEESKQVYVHPVYRQAGVVLLGYALGMYEGSPIEGKQDLAKMAKYRTPEEFKDNFPSYTLYTGFKDNFDAFKDIIPKLYDPAKCNIEMIQLNAVMSVVKSMYAVTLKDIPEVTHSDDFIEKIIDTNFFFSTYVNLSELFGPNDGFCVAMDGKVVNISGIFDNKVTILAIPHTSYYDTLDRFPYMWAIYKAVEQVAYLDPEKYKNPIESPGFGFIPSHTAYEFIIGNLD